MRREGMATWMMALLLSALLGAGQVMGQGAQKILFYSDRDGDQEIYMMDVDGGNVVQLTHNTANDNTPRWSPDGTKISFVSDRDGSYDVFVMDADGGNVVKLSNSSHSEGDPYWSPDGSQILFSWSTTSGGWDKEVFVVNADGTNLTQITNTPSTNQHPRWSPDGSKIIVSSYRTEQHCLFVMDPDGSNQTQLTSPWIGSWCCPGDNLPAWSPDGTRIAFSRDRGWQSRGLFIMNADGSGQTQFSIGLTREENAVWSPDGATIVFQGATSYNGDYHLWLIDADDSNPRELTGESGKEVIPSWSPDGSKILFASNRDGDYELYTIDPDGSNLTQLTFNDVADYPAGMGAWTSAYSSPVSVTVPSVTTAYDASLVIPVDLAGVEEREIVSAEVFLGYDSSLLTFDQVITDQLLADGWKIELKDVAGTDAMRTVRIAAATGDLGITSDGTLLEVEFTVADTRAPDWSPLILEHVVLNDGTPESTATDGSVTLVGVDGTIESDPVEIIPRWDVDVTVTDADEDRDGLNSDSFEVAVTNGSQMETVTVEETGANTGIFAGSIATEFSLAPVADDGIVQAKAGDAIEFCYGDSLEATGVTVERCATTAVIGGHDSQLRTTVVSQPGDKVRIRVIDADLSESVAVSAANGRTGEVETILLSAFEVGSSHFLGRLFTDRQAGTVGDSTLEVAKGDTLVVTYADTLTAAGGAVAEVDDDEVVDPFGDADGNGSVQAFDAAQVLWHRLQTYGGGAGSLSGLDSLSANVDSLAPFGIIDGYDASLVLRKVVGLVDRFQVQEPNAANQPDGSANGSLKRVADERLLTLRVHDGYASVWAEEREGIVAGELEMAGLAGEVVMGEEMGDFLVASRGGKEGLQVVFAGVQAAVGPGELLRVYSGAGPGSVRLTRASFNGGRIGARVAESEGAVRPLSYALYANAPNPFNPQTSIGYALPVASEVELTVYDVVGQRVRVLVSGVRAAGRHEAVWDGRNDSGQQVSSGVYFYRLEARGGESEWRSNASRPADLRFVQTRRMLLLK